MYFLRRQFDFQYTEVNESAYYSFETDFTTYFFALLNKGKIMIVCILFCMFNTTRNTFG